MYCTMYNVQCTMYNVQCTMYNVQCTMYNVLYIVNCPVQYNEHCTVHCKVFTNTLYIF